MTFKERYKKERADFAEFMKFYPFTLEDLDGEQWADIEGYEGRYQISTFGRVKSLPWKQRPTPRILCPKLSTGNYLDIVLWKNDKPKPILIHRLVAQAFIPNPDNKPQINHIDGCKINAYVGNLEWATPSENIRHAFDTGLHKAPQGADRPQAKLTNGQVRYIRDNIENLNTVELAKIFGVTSSVISAVQLGKTYKNVGGKIRQEYISLQCEKNTQAKLTTKQVRFIRDNLDNLSTYELAKIFGVSATTIGNVQTGKTYKNAGGRIRQPINYQGEGSPNAKLTNEQALYIRDNPKKINMVELAKLFGVTVSTISDVQIGKSYITAGGKIRQFQKRLRLNDESRAKIRAEYVKGSKEFGCHGLAKKYGVNPSTICDIIHEK